MDTISNFLTTLVNAQRVQQPRIVVPYSRLAAELARLLQRKGRVVKVDEEGTPLKRLVVTLAYDEGEQPRVHGVRRISKPGRRVYAGKGKIPFSYDGIGLVVVSTPKGLMADKEARRHGIGGELMCEVW